MSPYRSAGSLTLAGRRLGGEKARRREQEGGGGGAGGLEGGVEGGQQAGEGGLKQRTANHPEASPAPGTKGTGEECGGLLAFCLFQWSSHPAASLSPDTSLLGATTKCCFLEVTVGGSRNPWQESA